MFCSAFKNANERCWTQAHTTRLKDIMNRNGQKYWTGSAAGTVGILGGREDGTARQEPSAQHARTGRTRALGGSLSKRPFLTLPQDDLQRLYKE